MKCRAQDLGAHLRGRTTKRASKKGSEKVLGGRVLRRVPRRGLAMGFTVLSRGFPEGA